jgi:anti-anti-sigma regulatory factor
MQINDDLRLTVLQPEGRLGLEQANGLLEQIQAAEGDVEFDFSKIDLIEVSMLQVILVTVASIRRRGRTVVVKDSDSGVLRSTLRLTGIKPAEAGLSASLVL